MKDYRYIERSTVHGVEWMRSRGGSPRGLVIAPPLIGGHALQQLRLLRPLVRRRLDLISFNYAGHGASQGAFSLRASIENSLAALDLALDQSRKEGLPLYGLASCFGAYPLLKTVHLRGEPLSKIVLINALPNLRWEKMALAFLQYWRSSRNWRPTLNSLKTAMKAYREELLPNVAHQRQAFGILPRHRVKWTSTIWDLIAMFRVKSETLRSTQVLSIYGRQDRFLRQFGFSSWGVYERRIKSVCPQARFLSIDGDHFLKGKHLRQQLIEAVMQFFHMG